MTGTLGVYMLDSLAGHLVQDDHGQNLFEYTNAWLKNPKAIPLSLSLPLQEGKFGEKQCKPFFAGVLPDDIKRKIIARNLGISAKNDFTMLEQIGGECAGAVTFIKEGTPMPAVSDGYRALTGDELAIILKDLPKRPLMAGENGVRLSLAGAQDKIAVFKKDDNLLLPLSSAPSSHIIKPTIEQYPGMVFNEAFCMMLAKRLALPVANVELGKAGDIDYLIIERYDRIMDDKKMMRRIHQEDFCQAMGIVPDLKYQIEGGPSIKQCFELIRAYSSTPAVDLLHLLDAVIFNFLIGNHDAHGKNFSLLYQANTIRLAPLYDLICTASYPELSKKMAMKIGKATELVNVGPDQFERLADEITFSKQIIKRKVVELAKQMVIEVNTIDIGNHPNVNEVKKFIHDHCTYVLDRFTIA